MSRTLPPLTLLRCFDVASRAENFSAAADALCVTPSAVSHQIKLLESFLGRQLFVRTQQRMRLTEDGIAYAQRIGPVFREIENATRELLQSRGTARLTIQVAPTLATAWLVPILADFIHKHPSIQIQLITYGASDGSDSAHCEIRYGHGKWPGTDAELLWTEKLQPMVAAANDSIKTAADLFEAVLIHTRSRARGWLQLFRKYGLPLEPKQPPLVFDRSALALEAASAGIGIALESPLLARKQLQDGILSVPLDGMEIDDEAYYFITGPGEISDPVRQFRTWLAERMPVPGEIPVKSSP